jgi:hypothetical protein
LITSGENEAKLSCESQKRLHTMYRFNKLFCYKSTMFREPDLSICGFVGGRMRLCSHVQGTYVETGYAENYMHA